MLTVGFDTVDVTPSEPCRMAGYNRPGTWTSVLDPIQVNSIAWTVGDESFILTVLDSIMLEPAFCNQVKAGIVARTGLRAEHITVACIHTHSAPAFFKLAFEDTPAEPELTERACSQMVESALRAWDAQQPATCTFEKMEVEGLYGNRNVKGGVEDKHIYLLTFAGADGSPIGACFNISAHPTILDGSSYALSADLIGQIRLRLVEALGCPVLATNGTCGDVSTRFYRESSGMDELMHTAQGIFDQLMSKKQQVELPCGGPVRAASVEFPTTYDAATDADWQEMTARIEEMLAKDESDPMAQFYMARQQLKLNTSPIHLDLVSQIIVMGKLIIVTLPGDICSELGRRIKSSFPEHEVVIIGYANTYCNYLVPDEDYGKYFETFNSRTTRGASDCFIANVIGTIKTLVA